MADPATLRLLSWLSPAFPTGGFAYSHGVEWAVESGDIKNGPTLQSWLETLLRHGTGRSDAILCRHAHRAANNPEALAQLTELALAATPAAERRAETIHQGNAFRAAATPWPPHPPHEGSEEEEEPSPLLTVRPKRKTRFFLENAITKARRRATRRLDGPNPGFSRCAR
jgi:urease accessory protein